jgi:Fur family ferric uptake transcriptional regulator
MKNATARDTLSRYLRDKKFRVTRERQLLLDEIMRIDRHFDADELYTLLKKKGLKASRATVYNNLDLLVDSGLIRKYTFGENRARYEKAFGQQRHDHLICLECGEIIEFVNEKLDKIQQEVCDEHDFIPQNATLQIFGVCAKCQMKKS